MIIESLKSTIRYIIQFSIFILFKIFLNRFINKKWMDSTLAIWNNSGKLISCPYCGSNRSDFFRKILINNGFGIFDRNKKALCLYYGTWIPENTWNYLGTLRDNYLKYSFSELKNKLHVHYFRCKDCAIVFQNFPHDTSYLNEYYYRYYRRTGGKFYGRAYSTESDHIKWKELITANIIKTTNLPQSSKVLDVGSAEGCFCYTLKNFGMDAYGIETAKSMTAYAKEILKLDNITCNSYDISSYQADFFDVIHCFHVLEHILDTGIIFQSFAHHLKLNGILSLSVPCIDLAKNDTDYKSILIHDHVFIFSEKWFHFNLPKFGFDIFKISKTNFDISTYGDDNPGKKFSVSPWGDVPGGIHLFARKVKNININR